MKIFLLLTLFFTLSYPQNLVELFDAASTNKELESKKYLIDAQVFAKKAIIASYYPRIEGGINHTESANVGSFEPKSVESAYLKSSFVLFDGFKRENTIDEATANIESQTLTYRYARESLYLSVTKEFYGYFSNVAEIESLNQKNSELDEAIKRAKQMYESGLLTLDILEGLKAQMAENNYKIETFKLLLNSNLKILELYTNQKIKTLTYCNIKESDQNRGKRDDIKALEKNIESMKYKADQNSYLPSALVNLQNSKLEYRDTDTSVKRELPDYQSEITINISMPLFDDFAILKTKESIRAQKLSLESQKNYLDESLKKELEMKELEYSAQAAKIESAKSYLASADIAYSNSKKRFEAGLIGYVEYLEGLSKKYDANALLKKSQNGLEVIKAELCHLKGKNLTECVEGLK